MANLKIKAVLFCIVFVCSTLSGAAYAQEPEKREYISENGRKIKISSMGNLVGLESPAGYEHIASKRTRQGYVLAYDDPYNGRTRVLHDVFDSYSTTIELGKRDFVPVSFTAPPSKTVFKIYAQVSATVIVDTRDGLLRLTRRFTWRAGTGTVNVSTTITNRSKVAVNVLSFKENFDVDVSGSGTNGTNDYKNGGVTDPGTGTVVLYDGGYLCNPFQQTPICPPRPEPPFAQLLMRLRGNPAPTFAIFTSAYDNSGLESPDAGQSLPDLEVPADTQQTLGWRLDRKLIPGESLSPREAEGRIE